MTVYGSFTDSVSSRISLAVRVAFSDKISVLVIILLPVICSVSSMFSASSISGYSVKYSVIPHFIYLRIMLYSAELKRGTA